MKARLLFALILVSITGYAFANNESSELTTSLRTASNFYGVIINTPANVIISQGENTGIKIEGEKHAVAEITTSVNNGALVISGTNNRAVTIYLTVNDLSMVEVNGSARVYANGVINSDMLLLKVNGSGSIRMDVRTLTIGMIVKGSGKIIASGSTGQSFSKVFGSGNIYCSNLDSFDSARTTTPASGGSRSRLSLHQ
ncbi:MAG: DUF2807 domain-containing protein [Bacteroidetes bacterium]|nr:DUF2807 domain-containing protein [Bacteroidota bacterium]